MNESPCYKQYANNSTILAWIHSHVNGAKCFMSSIDLHTQFILENNFPNILAIVVQIGPGNKFKNECYQLSEKGSQRIQSCNNENKHSPNVLHKYCSYPRFFECLTRKVDFSFNTFVVIDKRSHHKELSSRAVSNEIKTDQTDLWICKACDKRFNPQSILRHLRVKKCRIQFTSEEIVEFGKQSDTARRKYQSNYQSSYRPKYNEANKLIVNKRQSDYDSLENNKAKKAKYKQVHNEEIKTQQQQRRKIARKEMTENDRFLAFKRDIVHGPNFTCHSCKRSLFKCSVRILHSTEILKLISKLDDSLLEETGLVDLSNFSDLVLCFNCYGKLNKNKFPNLNVNNGLNLDVVPPALASLKDLEQQLIALSLIFMKIKQLPGYSRMRSLGPGKVISVPIETADVTKTISKLPRHPKDSEIVAVKLKKKVEYKSAYLEEFVRPKNVIDAVKELKACGNAYYQGIQIDNDFLNNDTSDDQGDSNSSRMQEKTLSSSLNDDNEDSDDESRNPVKKYQSKQDSNTCLIPLNLDSQVVSNITKKKMIKKAINGQKSIEIAPGENKIPTGRVREKDGDVKAFPKHFPSGKFGISFPRKYKLSLQMYLLQRLLNEDERFSKDNFYLFMASSLVEQDQLERQINISGIKGLSGPSVNGEKAVKLQDPYSVFKKLKGTPKYWQTAKYELIAKVKQLGPFHLFYTFSCGEMR